ncbi:heme lyase CcmF/NrfE family subunit [Dasania sp. GY-MA-18]|uniref:Heme lyase CcmF/NrfE family subunit n=1 Tax=Dasania phycosphaerae TaxID=2950436 RepID=A0A9J6RI65_9GAMM|nr:MULTISPECIES: heme lyase CcmF/NrfE family subunit [Dasania]MCR8921696.1 heme lyase CcmF/NrfE family subunit [Dasania sp. GY-MA-18]MCZ0864124.1 heme lyase CcmF/NrfE family subunit [Dasania phycosphaerae]MCZ0867852.1 heme lyase CcmF/NrfE family subunit [Dasania phycosphaerae]
MLPEYGHFALILALVLALLQASLPLIGALTGNRALMATARSLAAGQFVFISLSFIVLCALFMQSDFSVVLVARHSNTLLPDIFKFSAVWGNHEGSLLLWVWILSLWSVAVALFSRQLPLDMVARVLSVMGMISIGFLLFSLLTSNPFARQLFNVPAEGADLNPLLQDFGLVIHPPMLYVGYVGFSVAFAFAIAALSSGRLDTAWARWSRPWTNIAWAFLTVGIALGSWWAYYELGWGGWWFWDPVENASFMPWIIGTALIHSLAATEKRGVFNSWTVLLAIIAFSLSLLGTFLVRSGVLTSVHSFAADPERGMFILIFLFLVVGGSLTLYALRAPTVASRSHFAWLSREFFLLINNVLLLVAMLTVLFGTLFPLLMDAMGMGKYSVGPPYFNAVFVPIMALLFVFMGIGPSARWKKTSALYLRGQLLTAALVSVACGLLFPLLLGESYSVAAALAVCFSLWLILSMVVDIREKTRNAVNLVAGLKRLTRAYYGMVLGHVGMAICALGVCLTSQYSVERDLRMQPGDIAEMAGYQFEFKGSKKIQGPNYAGERGLINVLQNGELIAELKPEKRRYFAQQGQVMTEADIDAGLMRDLYVAMGEPLANDAWAVRLHYKPFVRWMWLGGLIMAFGAVLAALDKRYRLKATANNKRAADSAAALSIG